MHQNMSIKDYPYALPLSHFWWHLEQAMATIRNDWVHISSPTSFIPSKHRTKSSSVSAKTCTSWNIVFLHRLRSVMNSIFTAISEGYIALSSRQRLAHHRHICCLLFSDCLADFGGVAVAITSARCKIAVCTSGIFYNVACACVMTQESLLLTSKPTATFATFPAAQTTETVVSDCWWTLCIRNILCLHETLRTNVFACEIACTYSWYILYYFKKADIVRSAVLERGDSPASQSRRCTTWLQYSADLRSSWSFDG